MCAVCREPRRRRVAQGAGLALVASLLSIATNPPATAALMQTTRSLPKASAVASGSLESSPSQGIAGETVNLKGRVPPRKSRPIVLQRKSADTWVKVAKGKTTKKGRFSFKVKVGSKPINYRVFARKVRLQGTWREAIRTRKETIRPQDQVGSISLPTTSFQGDSANASVVFSPARPGRLVVLQLRGNSGWAQMFSSSQSASGRVQFTLPTSVRGSFTYRAVAKAFRGATAATSAEKTMNVVSSPTSTLLAGSQLAPGQSLQSENGSYRASMQADGNLLVRGPGTTIRWASSTSAPGSTLRLQADGNLVIYSLTNVPQWSSQTAPSSGNTLVMQNDGNLVVYSRGGLALWGLEGLTGNRPNELTPDKNLLAGQSLWSHNGKYQAIMQSDGNFVVYEQSVGATWATHTTGATNPYLRLQGDGNLVVYGDGGAKWTSSTAPASNTRLIMQEDGNLVMYSRGGVPIWAKSGNTRFRQDQMTAENRMNSGQALWSNNGRYMAVMQGDGNFVVYKVGEGATWSSGTAGVPNAYIRMQSDGNLVIYGDGGAKWSSNTAPASGATLIMQDDGNLVIYAGGAARWSMNGAPSPGSAGGYPDADAVDCRSTFGIYSWCKNGDWYHPTRRFAYRNCTDYVSWRIGRDWGDIQSGGSGHAKYWRQGWIDRGRTVSTTPKIGAVAWWGATADNEFGHVAYVIAVNGNGTVRVAEYNKNGTGLYGERDSVVAPYYLY